MSRWRLLILMLWLLETVTSRSSHEFTTTSASLLLYQDVSGDGLTPKVGVYGGLLFPRVITCSNSTEHLTLASAFLMYEHVSSFICILVAFLLLLCPSDTSLAGDLWLMMRIMKVFVMHSRHFISRGMAFLCLIVYIWHENFNSMLAFNVFLYIVRFYVSSTSRWVSSNLLQTPNSRTAF